ncbi:hypothetical protein Angca_002033, partial [Angiostrongylus cantonensis]
MSLNNDNNLVMVDSDLPFMSSNVVKWAKIVKKQKQHMDANLITGQCSWELPPGAS